MFMHLKCDICPADETSTGIRSRGQTALKGLQAQEFKNKSLKKDSKGKGCWKVRTLSRYN